MVGSGVPVILWVELYAMNAIGTSKKLGAIFIRFLILFLMVPTLGGCLGSGTSRRDLQFSPDGEQICHLRVDYVCQAVVDGDILSRSIYLHWADVDDLEAAGESIHIGDLGWKYKDYVSIFTKTQWSPDGSHIAVLTGETFVVVELASGTKETLAGGEVVNFAWLSKDELAYCTSEGPKEAIRRIVRRRNVTTGESAEVFTSAPSHAGDWGGTYWSPSGQFLIVAQRGPTHSFHCVNVLDGSVQSFAEPGLLSVGVAWSPDSTQAFCVALEPGRARDNKAWLLTPNDGNMLNLTEEFQAVFPDSYSPGLQGWTRDGRYVIINVTEKAGHLICPDPWEVIPLGQILRSRYSDQIPADDNPWLYPLNLPGRVTVVPSGNWGDSPQVYTSDYDGQQLIPLPVWYGHAISPDGTTAAEVYGDGTIRLYPLDSSGSSSDTP